MIILENSETGETREVASGTNWRAPWIPKNTVHNLHKQQERNESMERLAAAAADFGLPVHVFSYVGGLLLGCPYCIAAGEVEKLYEQGKISREEHKELFMMAANAKDQRDEAALKKLKGKLEGLRKFN